jgi:hypothetical protein
MFTVNDVELFIKSMNKNIYTYNYFTSMIMNLLLLQKSSNNKIQYNTIKYEFTIQCKLVQKH